MSTIITCLDEQHSSDGSIKFLWSYADRTTVESIFFTFPQDGQEQPFLCISCQDGCNVGCGFCATGLQGMRRNLTADEMVAQVEASLEAVAAQGGPARVAHLAFAGMGEPLLNYQAVIETARRIRTQGLAKIVSVSTSGIAPRIPLLAKVASYAVNRLYISLHATTNALRNYLVPINCPNCWPQARSTPNARRQK